MTNSKTKTILHASHPFLAALAAALAACGSQGGGTSGAVGGATFRGEISSLAGGLTVNGRTFRTVGAAVVLPDDGTSVTIQSEAELETHLDVGMVVTVTGKADDSGTGEASEIEFEHSLEGEVEVHGAGHVQVLGEDVSVDGSTNVVDRHGDPLSSDDLVPGTRIEVSGHGDARGGIRATHVRVRDDRAGEDEELKGFVVAVNGAIVDLAFTRGGPVAVQVDVSGLSPAPALAVDDFVEVKTRGERNADGILLAVSVKAEDGSHEAEHGHEAEVEGIVSEVDAAAGTFVVDGQPVHTSAATIYEGGTADDVVIGAKVEAEGTVGADGVLEAEKVKFEAIARVDAAVEAIDPVAGTLTVLGLTVFVTPSTELDGLASLESLAVGYRVEVRGAMTRDGLGIDATRLTLVATSTDDRAFLRALVTAKSDAGLTLAGIAIDLSQAELNGPGGPPDLAGFLAAVTPGQTIVKVRWRPYPASTAEPVDEAEIEN